MHQIHRRNSAKFSGRTAQNFRKSITSGNIRNMQYFSRYAAAVFFAISKQTF